MRPFEGIKIIDATHVLAGPFASYQLALLGAEVIKVENPEERDQVRESGSDEDLNAMGMGTYYLTQASNKRSITLNLKTEEGRDLLKKLVSTADVFVENFRAGSLATLGLGFDDLVKLNDRLIYCSLTAFGQGGPRESHTGYDMQIQASSGLMSSTGTPEVNPIKVGPPVVDYASGTMAAFAIASALFQREKTSKAQFIDQAMFDVALMLMSADITNYTWSGHAPKPLGNDYPSAGGRCYQTEDGLLMMGAMNRAQHKRLFDLIGEQQIAAETDYVTRFREGDSQAEILADLLKSKSAEAWETYFQDHHIPATKVRTLPEALDDPQLAHRNLTHNFPNFNGSDKGLTVPLAAFNYLHGGPSVETPPATMGQHTNEVLREFGVSDEELAQLRKDGVV